MRLNGKVAAVTGAASGFGEAIARRFAEEGAKVVVADINDSSGQAVAESLGAAARFVQTDVSRGDDMARMVAAALDSYGGLDILVNNAGFTHRNGPMLDVTEEEIDQIYAVNVKSLYFGVCALNPVAGDTGMLHLFLGDDTPERRQQFVSTIPLGRLSTPRDIADSALFLCSDEAQFLTGVCLEVDGGRCI